MPKEATKLSAKQVDALKPDGKVNRRVMVGDCAGLHIRIEGGSKVWALRVKVGDKRRDIGLGRYNGKINKPDAKDRLEQLSHDEVVKEIALLDGLSLGEARVVGRKLRAHYRATRSIVSPTVTIVEATRSETQAALVATAKTKTFKECAELCISDKSGEWKNAKHSKQWGATLETYAYPKLGKLPVAAIDRGLVLDVLRPIWTSKSETASRLRGRIETVLNWAKVNGYREGENPAAWKGNLEHSLAKRQRLTRGHHAALPYEELGGFMVDLRKREGLSARALEFAILTAARSGEVREATWDEVDLETRIWTVPAERMKMKRAHEVPLSDAAVALLKALPRVKGAKYLFPAPRGGAMSDMALTAVLKRMDVPVTAHGFRSTFRDWVAERTRYPRELAEYSLAHGLPDKVEAAYQRRTLLPERVKLMAEWATYCGTVQAPAGNVVGIREGAVA